MDFTSLGLIEPLLRAVADEGYTVPTPIQVDAIPHVLAGRDLLGTAQTGTGKTAAFTLPMLQLLAADRVRARPRAPRALVVTPTRELAIQIDASVKAYGRYVALSSAVIFGGVGQNPQVQALGRGVDILVATPGRLLDLVGQGHVNLGSLKIFVLDEADRMLDMGFLPDVRKIIALIPKVRQSLFFSATMPPSIIQLSSKILTNPVQVSVDVVSSPAERVTQRVAFVDKSGKNDLLAEVLRDERVKRALVFTRTKHGANRVVEKLERVGIAAKAIHGNKSQSARQRALEEFRSGETAVLVATDLAARGLDIDDVTHVINFDLPNEPESYVHRIGRTARAGASGLALSFCDANEVGFLRDIERLIGAKIPVAIDRRSGNERAEAPAPHQGRGGGGRGDRRGRRF
jgi:ATP-dependent RNA helicase RhlE